MGLMEKLKLGPHYRMERFSLLFCVMVVGILVTTVSCFVAHVQTQNTTLGEQAIYSTEFETSKTGVSGKVIDVYSSEDKAKTLLLLKFDDTKVVSTNADNYQMFLTGASVEQNKQTLDGIPSGSIYMFGNTGYMGIYLVNKDGFGPQILDLVVRCNSELQTNASEDVDEEVEDKSFVDYDQFRVYFNPGASKAKHLDCLDGSKAPSIKDFYNEAVITPQEDEIHAQLETQVNNMRVSLNQIHEYEERLETEGVTVPAEPSVIVGDKVITNDDGSYTYKPSTVLPGGYDLDWQHTSVVDGFIKGLIKKTDSPNMTVDQYFAMMTREANADASGNQLDTNNIEWQLNDGTLISSLSGGKSSRYTEYMEMCNDLTNAWRTYYNQKVDYQREMLGSLLDLEVSKDGILTSSSVNTSENVLQCY
ncbi:hypothetical protein [Alistipes putredinis]|uniref:hypothetical protein n=1 Tax=Alistipes putredinis TaxID=28117 RepID=UPI003AB7E4E5